MGAGEVELQGVRTMHFHGPRQRAENLHILGEDGAYHRNLTLQCDLNLGGVVVHARVGQPVGVEKAVLKLHQGWPRVAFSWFPADGLGDDGPRPVGGYPE